MIQDLALYNLDRTDTCGPDPMLFPYVSNFRSSEEVKLKIFFKKKPMTRTLATCIDLSTDLK